VYDATVPAEGKVLVSTYLSIQLPAGYGHIAPLSGLALYHIDAGGGIVDEDYRGIVSAPLQSFRGTIHRPSR
jgi:dUTPase